MTPSDRRILARVVGAYTVLSVLWIVLSDRVLAALVRDPEALTQAQSAKGLAFVIISALFVFAVLARELSMRRRMEAQLDASDARFRAAFDAVSAYMMTMRARDARIVDINVAWATALGTPRTALVGKTWPEAGMTLEGADRLLGALRGGQSVRAFEHAVQTPAGVRLELVTCADPVEVNGEPGWLLVATDVSELRRAERDKQLLERQFQQAQKMEALGTLAGGVAHDFNNLLGVIMSYADFTQESLTESHPARDDIAEIIRAGKRASSLTQQLLAFCRQQTTEATAIDLSAAFRDLERMLRRLIGEDVELVVDVDSDLPPVMMDPRLLDQAIINLAVNARDAMPQGGTLTLEAAQVEGASPTPVREAVTNGAWVRVRVRDDGVGMDAETKARAFEPFFTTKGQDRGTGLGLALVYGAVTQAGGAITVESAVGDGTTFELWLPPASPKEVEAVVNQALKSRDLSGTESILVVEDEEPVRQLVRRILNRHGYDVVVAPDAKEALRLIDEGRRSVDLVISDVVLPRMSGVELGRHLGLRTPPLPVLFMTGYIDETTRRHGLSAERAELDLIRKPFTPSDFVARVRAALDRSRASTPPAP